MTGTQIVMKVELPLEVARQALAVPRDAVVIRADGAAVYRINRRAKCTVCHVAG